MNVVSRCARAIAFILVLQMLTITQIFGQSQKSANDHLLLSEAIMTPLTTEFIEIANPTDNDVDLTNYYLSDAQDYYLLPGATGNGPPPDITSRDFIAQFPAGAIIPARGVVVVAMDAVSFLNAFGFRPDFEFTDNDFATPDMIDTDIGRNAELSTGGEGLALFYWDGLSDLVQDVDLINVGTPTAGNRVGNKSNLSVDGPDADSTPSVYEQEFYSMQIFEEDHNAGLSAKRQRLEGDFESVDFGNGITGDDETTENIYVTWGSVYTEPDPGEAPYLIPPVANVSPIVSTVLYSENIASHDTPLDMTAYITDDHNVISAHIIYTVNGGVADSIELVTADDIIYTGAIPATANQNENLIKFHITAVDDSGAVTTTPERIYFAGISSITSLRATNSLGEPLYAGHSARIKGIATVGTGVFSTANHDFYLEDGTSGINIFQPEAGGSDVALGDSILVEGIIQHTNGNFQFDDPDMVYSILSTNPAPEPFLINIADIGEAYEGRLVKFRDLTLVDGEWPEAGDKADLLLETPDGQQLDVRIERETEVDELPEPDWPVDLVGILQQWDRFSPYLEDWRLQLRYPSDIQISGRKFVLNEIMYNPADFLGTDGDFEYLEFTNISDQSMDIGGYRVGNAVDWTWPAGTIIGPDEIIILASNPDSIFSYFGKAAYGPWTGELDNNGETVLIYDNTDYNVDSVAYSGFSPWPTAANGDSSSLELINPRTDNANYQNWRASNAIGTPGNDNTVLGIEDEPLEILPDEFALMQNYPNPFNPVTTIQYVVEKTSHVRITVFNVIGQPVTTLVDQRQAPGLRSIVWNGKSANGAQVSSGVYFYRMEAGDFIATKKMLYIR